jgi:clorobiocin/coumermycin A biosynthesis protein CloN7/CouN7
VPGARLYFEVQGSGPALMLIGHPMDSSGFAPIATMLADEHTVITYDPRGFGRSPIDDPEQDAEPDMLADDVRRVIEAVGVVPAHVFGSSGGAITGLALVASYPERVRSLIAHEPPLTLLLPDAEEASAGVREIYDTYGGSGVDAAWQRFVGFTGINTGPPDQSAPTRTTDPAALATSERFFGHGLLPIALYQPDFTALGAVSGRVVVAGGSTSEGEFAHRAAAALADRLGTLMVMFPGGHGGFASDPDEFVAVLRRTLA